MGIGRGLFVWMLASFLYAFFEPIARGSNQAIWQVKVAPELQGRVFGARFLASQITVPGAMMLVGPLADHVFEPAMMSSGELAGALGWLVGPGSGAGMALLCVCAGLLAIVVPLIGYAVPLVRDVEKMIPDHDLALQEALS
jgi:hypothetical protein